MLKHKARSALLWSGAEILLRQGFYIVVTIVLARLLAPEVFGTVALLYLFGGLANVFVDGGFSAALIQRKDITHTDESTVFWFNLLMATVLGLAFCISAPAFARFYGQPVLVPLVMLLALNLFLSALSAIHTTLLTRHLEFRLQMKVSVAAGLVSGVVAITMAWAGYGIWALAAQVLVATSVNTLLLWLLHAWRPARVFSMESVRRLFAFGGYLMIAALMDVFYTRIYSLLIGKMHGVRELGFYNRADGAREMPMGILGSLLVSVAFPVFSAAAGDREQLRQGVRFSIRSMMLLNIPMMLGLMAVSGPLIVGLFGQKWQPAVPILQVMCLASLLWPLLMLNLQVLKAQGHSHLFFRLEVFKKVLGTLFLVAGAFFGVLGIVWSTVLFTLIAFLINAHYTGRFLDYGPRAQIMDCLPVLALAVPMALLVGWLEQIWQPELALLELVVLAGVGAGMFLSMAWLLRLPHLAETIKWFRSRPR